MWWEVKWTCEKWWDWEAEDAVEDCCWVEIEVWNRNESENAVRNTEFNVWLRWLFKEVRVSFMKIALLNWLDSSDQTFGDRLSILRNDIESIER